MAGLFQPKRVVVPGLLSDDGLAVRVKELTGQTKAQAAAAPPLTSAVDASNQITTEALKPSPTVKAAPPRTPGVELSAGAPAAASPAEPPRIGFGGTVTGFDVGKAIVQAGTLTPEQGEADRAERAAQAGAEAEVATGELAEKTKLLTPDERAAIGLPPLTPEDMFRLAPSIEQEQQIVRDKQERATFIAEGPPTAQAEWLNIAQVSTRSAIQMGVGALRYPADIWDTLAALEKGSDTVKKSEASLWIDSVDKELTRMMPGDPTRSKDFVTKLAAGGGSMVGFMVTGWVGRAVGLPAWLTTGTLGAAVEGDSLYQEADTFGATATQKAIALFAGSGLGVTEAIPIDRAFMRADVASGGMIRNLLANTTSTSLEEFIQEASQTLGEDIIAKYGAAYDPKREISLERAGEAGLIGAITGGVAGAATTLLGSPGAQQELDPIALDEAQQTEVVDNVLAAEEQNFAAILGDEAADGQGGVATADAAPDAGAPAGGETARARPAAVTVDQPRGDAVQQIIEPQAAFHGTPHKFDRFSMEKIGTGEGAQAYGYGLYFAGNKRVAEGYRKNLARETVSFDGKTIDEGWYATAPREAARAMDAVVNNGSVDDAAAQLTVAWEQAVSDGYTDRAALYEPALDWLNANRDRIEVSRGGALYQVDIPDDAELLDWDAPLSAQPETVQQALAGLDPDFWSPDSPDYDAAEPGQMIYSRLSEMLGGDAAASEALQGMGIPGLRYLDAGSRTAGDGTRNYVIFDDSRITITDVEAQQANLVTPDTMVAAADPQPNMEPLPGATGKPSEPAVKAVMAYAAVVDFPITRQVALSPFILRDVEVGALNGLSREQMRTMNRMVDTEDWQVVALPIGRIIGTQPNVNEDFREAAARRPDALPLIVRVNGTNYLRDGHHRVAAAQASGSYSVQVRFVDVDAALAPDPDAAQLDIEFMRATSPAQRTVARLYADMLEQPEDPAVLSSYNALVEEVRAQYAFAVAANGGDLPAFAGAPQYPAGHPLAPVADQFWSLYQFFGTGLEGATDPENMWQAYARVFSASARPAFTTETRGPQAWEAVNGEPAARKIGLMPSTAWAYDLDQVQIERMEVMAQRAQTETAEFKRWFGDSKVVDAEGRPLRVFHSSTYGSFSAFSKAEQRKGMAGYGFYFSDAPGAGLYADYGLKFQTQFSYRGDPKGVNITPVYLNIQKPLRVANIRDAYKAAGLDYVQDPGFFGQGRGPAKFPEEAKTVFQKRGYDGIITYEYVRVLRDGSMKQAEPGSRGAKKHPVYVVFEPTQIKSAIANVGTFDPNDPNIDRMTGTATARQPFIAEPTRPTRGIPTPSPAPADQEDVRLSTIGGDFRKLFDLTVRHGRLASRDSSVMGEYNRNTAAIRMRTWTDLSTLVHEGGHAINDSMAAPLNAFVQRNIKAINDIAHKIYAGDLSKATAESVRREGFAEFFRIYVLNPGYARNRWPALVTDFESTLQATDPKVLDGLNNISARFQAWLNLPSRQLIRNMIVDGRRAQGINAAVKELKDLGFKTWFHEHVRRATGWMINRYAAVADFETQLLNLAERNRGVPLDVRRSESPTAILRLARNAGSRAQVELTDGVIGYRSTQSTTRGLREALMISQGIAPDATPSALDEELLKDFDAYLVARRAWDEYRRFEAGELERPPIGASKGDVARAIKEYEQAQPQFAQAAQIVHEYGMGLWRKRYDAGLLDKETYEEGLQRQFYAPLQRDVSDKQGSGGNSISFGSSVLTKGPRFRGSDRDIISPMTVMMQMTFALERQIAENDAKRALAVLADRAGQAGALVERIPASQLVGQTFSVRDVARRLVADSDISAAEASDLMTILAGSIEQGDMMSLFRAEQAGTQGENVLFFWEQGKVAAIRLNESELAADVVNTMNAVGRENMDLPLELLAGTSTVFRTAITSWPDFLLINYIRDQASAWILGGTNYVPFVTGIRGIADEIRQKQWAKSYNAAGGILGGMNVASLHQARVDRDIRALRAKGYIANVFGEVTGGWGGVTGAIKGLGRLTAITETGTRLGLYRGAYDRAVRDGLSEYDASVEAAYIATDYIDFGLNGSKMLTSRRLIPFLNAQLQGLYKMFRTLGGDEVARRKGLGFALSAYFKNINNLPLSRLEKQQLRTGRSAWLKMLSLGFIGAAIWALFKDDEDYQETSEYLRTTGWVIPLGDGRIAYIPKPFELAVVSNAVERGLEYATGDTTAIDRFLRGLAFNLAPPTSPPAVQTVVETLANHDFFTGREIVPSYMQALRPELQYDNYTSSLAKWLGGVTGQSPMVVDHILSGMGASAYRDITTMLNAADPTRPMPDETDWPILRRFVRDVRRGATSAQDFWAQASNTNGKLYRAAASYKNYIEAGNEPAANRYLATLSADERAFAVLNTDFKAEYKRLNPFYRAQQVTRVINAMRRENASELGLGDTSVEPIEGMPPAVFTLPRGLRTKVDDVLSELARREVRNTMIATGQPGWTGKETLPLQPTLDMLLAVAPDVYDEYVRRYEKAKIYDAQAVYEYWPDVRDRLVQDGPDAVLDDAVAVASAGVVF